MKGIGNPLGSLPPLYAGGAPRWASGSAVAAATALRRETARIELFIMTFVDFWG